MSPRREREVPCLRCGANSEQAKRGRPTRYCLPCRREIKREHDRERVEELNAERGRLRKTAELMREHLSESMYAKLLDYLDDIGVPKDDRNWPIIADRMPEGATSDVGPDEGMTASYPDVQDELDRRRIAVIMHDWYAEHPHWVVGVND